MTTTRREFLSFTVTAGLGSVTLSMLAPFTRARLPRWRRESVRHLVVLQLSGGNDGLNTIVPFADDAYHRARRVLAIRPDAVLKLDDHVGLNPELRALRPLWDQGHVAIVQGVGYPRPDRSHFRSMDIWQTAAPDGPLPRTGWLGRAGDLLSDRAGHASVIKVGAAQPSLALVAERAPAAEIARLEDCEWPLGGRLKSLSLELARVERSAPATRFIAGEFLAAARQAEELAALKSGAGADQHPATQLGAELEIVSRLIRGGFGARIYQLELGGFDTHAQQRSGHELLLRQIAEAVAAFFKGLREAGCADQVLLMAFSEFGRRVQENGSRGTDHGAAAPVILISGKVRGGLRGAHPSLTDLDDGDLKHAVDFRRVYATVLSSWLGLDADAVLGGHHEPLPLIA